MTGPVLALAGGVGGAKLALGLSRVLPPDQLVIAVNTGDDECFHGLHVSPDLDTVMYTLAGLANPETGWGLAGDTFNALEMLRRYGADTWFNLGDRDLATHIQRTQLLQQGATLSEVTARLCRALGVAHCVVPMSDAQVRTVLGTDEGELPMQDYFVRRRSEPRVRSIQYLGAAQACPAPGLLAALDQARLVVLCPSNPFLSVSPILSLPGVRERLARFAGLRVAVSPIVGGAALGAQRPKSWGSWGMRFPALGWLLIIGVYVTLSS
jgi:LPPG:FO 2-phospho-L-lactate transferase